MSLAAHTPAEILEADLLPLALELANWGIKDPTVLRWLDVPPAATMNQAHELLTWLVAVDKKGVITAHGREMNSLATHPRLAHMLLKSRSLDLILLAAELAALLSERDILRSHGKERDNDMRSRVESLHGSVIRNHDCDVGAKQRVLRSADQLLQQLRVKSDRSQHDQLHETGRLLALAFPDRIARRAQGNRFVLVNGRGATLEHAGTLGNAEFIAIASLDGAGRDARIQLAAPVSLDDLSRDFADQIQVQDRVEWDEREQIVVAQRERKLGELVIESKSLQQIDPAQIQAALLQGILSMGLQCLPWSDSATALRTRMLFAKQHDDRAPQPWPDVTDEYLLQHLDEWLSPWLDGISRRSQLSRVDLNQVLLGLLDWNQQTRLNEIAPTHITVPSGSNIAIDYSGAIPTLSVRLQEVFGMTETPRAGNVPLLMELLSPARRPVQVTQDLASFWARGYHDVKKDLKGRYPKHYWPDDPLQAQATARAKPRGT
jgi:ATP-dependent helicase HrpB